MKSIAAILLSAPLTRLQKLLWLGGCLVFFAVLCGAFRYVRQNQIESELDRALGDAEQQGSGWRLAELEAAREMLPDEENSALIVQQVCRYFSPEQLDVRNKPAALYGLAFTTEPLDPTEEQLLAERLEPLQAALAEAYKLAAKPRGRYPLALDGQPWPTNWSHIDQVVLVRALLAHEIVYRCQRREFSQAALACRAAFHAVSSLGDEPFRVSQHERRTNAFHGCRAVHYVLNHAELDDRTLAELQRLIEDEARHPAFLIGMRGERALIHAEIDAIAAGDVPWQCAVDPNRGSPPAFWEWAPSADDIRRQHVAMVPILDRLIELAEAPPHKRQDLRWQIRSELRSDSVNLLAPLIHHLRECETGFTEYDLWLDCHVVGLALERYRLRHGDWPVTLDALTPEYLSQVPADPEDGQPLRYRRYPDGVAVYSLYANFFKQVFDPNRPAPAERGVAVRLWNPSQRGQPLPGAPGKS